MNLCRSSHDITMAIHLHVQADWKPDIVAKWTSTLVDSSTTSMRIACISSGSSRSHLMSVLWQSSIPSHCFLFISHKCLAKIFFAAETNHVAAGALENPHSKDYQSPEGELLVATNTRCQEQ